jgi:ATP-binding cassette subfamily B protein
MPQADPIQMGARPPGLPSWRIVRSAVRLVWGASRREVILLIGTEIASALALVMQLYLAKRVLDELTGESGIDSFDVLGPILGLLLLARVVVGLSSVLRGETRLVVYERVQRAAALELYEIAAAAELAEYDDAEFHDRLRRAHSNVERRIWSTVWSLIALGSALVGLLALAVVLIVLAPLVLLMALIGALPLWWVRRRNNEAIYRLSYAFTPDDRERTYLEKLLVDREPAGEIRAYDLGPALIRRIDVLFRDRVDRVRDLVRRRTASAGAASIVSNVIAIGAIAVLVQLMISGRMSVADGGVAILALQQAAARLASISESVGSLGGAALFLEDYETFLRYAVPPPRADVLSGDDLQELRFEDVTFTYPGQPAPVLHGVDLRVRKGELVGLVGVNGSGKSTIAKLMTGLYGPDSGSVVWETSLGPVTDRHRIRRTVGLVFQHFLRFELSTLDNVTLGDVHRAADRERAWIALESAGISEVIRTIPDGIDGRLGRSFAEGSELSAGQWQRVGIARAFFRDAPLLVLDEPTAAVDVKAEQELFKVVRSLQKGRAVVLITHRMATVREADRIYVLEGGRVVEVGTHQELMAAGAAYAELYELQARGYRDE